MGDKSKSYYIILFILFALGQEVSFAQGLGPEKREELMLTTLDYMQEKQVPDRDKAIDDSMKKAGIRATVGETKKNPFLSELASRTHPYLTQQTIFDDNIRSEVPRKTSVLNWFTPGFKMNFRERGRSLVLDMHINEKFYNNRSEGGSQSAEAGLLVNFNIGRYTASISETYYNNYDSARDLVIDDYDENDVQLRWKNTFSAIIGRGLSKQGFNAEYKRTDYSNVADYDYSDDRFEETYTLNYYLQVAPKTRLTAGYAYDRLNYFGDRSQNSHYHDFNLGLIGILTSKLTDELKWEYKLTDNKTGNDYKEGTFIGKLAYNATSRTNFAFTYKYFNHQEKFVSESYNENAFKLTGNHRLAFNPKFNLYFGLEADYLDYAKIYSLPHPGEESRYIFECTLSYAFRQWLDFSLDWKRTQQHCNNVYIDPSYNKDVVTFKTEAKF